MKPIRPSEVVNSKKDYLPDEVFEAFNELISKDFYKGAATVKQPEVAALIAKKLGITDAEVYKKHYLDVESVYEKAGWIVKYDRPGWNESGEAYFRFERKKV